MNVRGVPVGSGLRPKKYLWVLLKLGDNSTRRLTDTDTLQSELSNYPNTKKK